MCKPSDINWGRRLLCVALLAGLTSSLSAQSEPRLVMRGGNWWGVAVTRTLARSFAEPRSLGRDQFDSLRWSETQDIAGFADHQCDILIPCGFPNEQGARVLKEHFPAGDAQPQTFVAAYAKVAVVVHQNNPVKALTLSQIRNLLRSWKPTTQWSDLSGDMTAIKIYAQWPDDPSQIAIRHVCMAVAESISPRYYTYREDIQSCRGAGDVIQKVQKDQNAVGFILYHGQKVPSGVKLLAIGENDQGPFVVPAQGPLIQKDYPLSEPLVLYLHPKAPRLAKEFCEFAASKDGAEIIGKEGFITPYADTQARAEERLALVKSGKGPRLSAIGIGSGGKAIAESAVEYVKAKAVVQMSYAPTESDVSAMGAFVSGGEDGKELLLLADHPSERAMQSHGNKWNDLQPAEHMLAGRAAAIIVNPTSKLEALTLDQVRGVFVGETTDWSVLGGAKWPIKCIGLPNTDPAARVFYVECQPAERLKKVATKKDTAEAVAAVSMDAGAIAFVDMSSIPGIGSAALTGNFTASGQNVKILGIKLPPLHGEKARVIWPTAENIKSAMYPFSQRVYLYVHPKASDTAKDFAEFLATCGGSEAQPYADTVKAMMQTYQKHGLIPLADAALQRAAKDAMAAKAKEAAGGSGKKPDAPK